jgi:ABC-type phosphate transport system substrate-binding protein
MKTIMLLAGASAVALTMGANSAKASDVLVYGGGSTLAAKVYRDIFNCYSTKASGIFATTPATYPAGVSIQYPTAENSACTTQGTASGITFYEGVGSGAGLSAWTTLNPANFGSPATTNTIAYLDSTQKVNSTPYPEIQFAASDPYLSSTQASQAASTSGETVFQLPTFVTPIVIAVGQVQNVKLTGTDVCQLFASSTSKSAAGVKFSELVVRKDGSGTSFIFSDWLAKNCKTNLGFNSTNGFPSNSPNWTAVAAANGNHLPIVAESGTGGVASQVAATANALGYVSPDYAYPVVATSTAYPSYVQGYLPTVANVQARLNVETYPKTYDAATIGQEINDQLVAPGHSGYPIIGYTFIDTYSCYSASIGGGLIGGPSQGTELYNELFYFYSNAKDGILNSAGFVEPSTTVINLLKGTGGPLNKTGGIQNASCPKK